MFEIVSAEGDGIEAGDVVPLSATNCELAASTERTLVLGDVERDAPEQTDRAGYAEWGIECYIGAPVFVDEGCTGRSVSTTPSPARASSRSGRSCSST